MAMPSFYNLESMELYGIPTTIDGNKITERQGQVIVRMIGKFMDEAEHPLAKAIELAVDTFKRMYNKKDEGWAAKSHVAQHGGYVRNRYYNDDVKDRRKAMARRKIKRSKVESSTPCKDVMEAGARNSRIDTASIREVVKLALNQLNKEDRLGTLKNLGYQLKED